MKTILVALWLCCSFAAAIKATPPTSPATDLAAVVDSLLKAYSSKNVDAVLALADPTEVLVLGTDLSEVADSKEKVRALLAADFQAWGSAEFGTRVFTSLRTDAHLGSAAFDVPFTMHRADGSSDTMTIRFLTVWKRDGRRWLLTQSLNSVPTVSRPEADTQKRPKQD